MDRYFNNTTVRTACGGFLLMLTGAIAHAQVGSISFDGQTFVPAIADTKGGDRFVEFRLQGQSNDIWTRRVVFHSFPDSGNDVQRGVGNMIKWIKERDPKVRFGLIENKSGDAIVDFLLSPGVSDDVTLSCLRYTRAPDGKGLIALQYDERFKLGQVDGDDVKALRKRAIDTMAKFDMSEVKAWYARGKMFDTSKLIQFGTLPLDDLTPLIAKSARLQQEVNQALSEGNKEQRVVCLGMRFPGQWKNLGGLRVSPYTCDFGAKWLQIHATVRITDRHGRAFETITGKAMKNATKVGETNLNWEWTTECGTATYCAWYAGH